ncbi:hypothetical protein WR25_23589 [Diploscapter pachys]|uniref:Uncharacterized protein n=1 Tax=Diploscapter pachys TaxID=2018661 RepID=A0A2A2L2Q1_9BILA|nr:hypothetical protein WR25_23589 [Diploscapter pachys]
MLDDRPDDISALISLKWYLTFDKGYDMCNSKNDWKNLWMIIHEGAGRGCVRTLAQAPLVVDITLAKRAGTRKGKEEEKSRMWQMGRDIRDGMGEWEVKRKRGRAAEERREGEDRPRPLAAGLAEFELLNCIEGEL